MKNILLIFVIIVLVLGGAYSWSLMRGYFVELQAETVDLKQELEQKQEKIQKLVNIPNISATYAPILLVRQEKSLDRVEVLRVLEIIAVGARVKLDKIDYKDNGFSAEVSGDFADLYDFAVSLDNNEQFYIDKFDLNIIDDKVSIIQVEIIY